MAEMSLKELLAKRKAEEQGQAKALSTQGAASVKLEPVAKNIETQTQVAAIVAIRDAEKAEANETTKLSGLAALRAKKAGAQGTQAESKAGGDGTVRKLETQTGNAVIPARLVTTDAEVKPNGFLSKLKSDQAPQPISATPQVQIAQPQTLQAVPRAMEVDLTDVPAEHRIEVETLRRNLVYIADNIENKDLVGNVVRTIMVQTRQYPWLERYSTDADFNLIMRGARKAFNVAALQKQEARGKRGAKAAATNKLDEMFSKAGLDNLKF